MKVQELFEGDVVKHNFRKRKEVDAKDSGIDIPKGYDRFELDHNGNSTVASIIGIKGDKKTKISSGHLDLMKALVSVYNSGKAPASMKKISMVQAFGSDEMVALDDAGLKLAEKPDWSDFEDGGRAEKNNIHQLALKKAEKAFGEKFKEYSASYLFGSDKKPAGTMKDVKKFPAENMFIVKFDDGTKYLVDKTQARSYIRMWQKIV